MKEGEDEWGGEGIKGRREGGKMMGGEKRREGKRKGGKEEEGGKKKGIAITHGQLIKGDEIASGKQFYGLHGNRLPLLLYFILS